MSLSDLRKKALAMDVTVVRAVPLAMRPFAVWPITAARHGRNCKSNTANITRTHYHRPRRWCWRESLTRARPRPGTSPPRCEQQSCWGT